MGFWPCILSQCVIVHKFIFVVGYATIITTSISCNCYYILLLPIEDLYGTLMWHFVSSQYDFQHYIHVYPLAQPLRYPATATILKTSMGLLPCSITTIFIVGCATGLPLLYCYTIILISFIAIRYYILLFYSLLLMMS